MRSKAFGLAPSSSYLSEDKGGNDDDSHLRYFRRLELNAREGHPAGCAVYRSPVMNPISITSQRSDGYRGRIPGAHEAIY